MSGVESGVTEEALWAELVDAAGEELIEQAAAVSVAEAEQYLRAAGFDVAEERARAEAFLRSLEDGTFELPEGGAAHQPVQAVDQAPPEPSSRRAERPAPRSKRKGRPVVWAVAAAVTAGAAAAAYVATRPDSGTPPAPQPTSPPTTTATEPAPPLVADAVGLRRRAAIELREGRPGSCLLLLDQARDMDPAGDATPAVARLREDARSALEGKPKPPR